MAMKMERNNIAEADFKDRKLAKPTGCQGAVKIRVRLDYQGRLIIYLVSTFPLAQG
jgi:hypothetical protein